MRNLILMVTSLALVPALRASAPADFAKWTGEQPDWYQAQDKVDKMLLVRGRDIVDVVHEVTAGRPGTGEQAMIKIDVLLRVGMYKQAVEAVEQLHQLEPQLGGSAANGICLAACSTCEALPVARRVAELFEVGSIWPDTNSRLLSLWEKSGGTFEEIDAWLADRPVGRHRYWVKQRLRFNQRHGRGERLMRKLQADVMADPGDIDAVVAFLDILTSAGQVRDQLDLAWMPEAIKETSVLAAYAIGKRLQSLKQWEEATAFYERIMDAELDDAEEKGYEKYFLVNLPFDVMREGFAAAVRHRLAECLLKIGRADEAQRLIVEAADIDGEGGALLHRPVLAGMAQQAGGSRDIEDRILRQEELSKDDPQYWRQRAEYYRARRQTQAEEQALLKGLSLTEPNAAPRQLDRRSANSRSRALSDYVSFLRRAERSREAVELLRREMFETSAGTEAADKAAEMLAFDFERFVAVEDEKLWEWLGSRNEWGRAEQRMLWRMLEKADDDIGRNLSREEYRASWRELEKEKTDRVNVYLTRAEKLAGDGDATRAYALGWIENTMGFRLRAIRLLERAVDEIDDDQRRKSAASILLGHYVDVGDLEGAKRVFPRTVPELSEAEVLNWSVTIALVAARAGDKDEAMRIWRIWANANPARAMYLDRLAKAGLREQLRAYYRRLAERLPQSQTPEIVLNMLAE